MDNRLQCAGTSADRNPYAIRYTPANRYSDAGTQQHADPDRHPNAGTQPDRHPNANRNQHADTRHDGHVERGSHGDR